MGLEFRTFTQLILTHFPDIGLIQHDLLVQGGQMLLGGPPGVGKSMLAMQLSYELALGRLAFGAYQVTKPLRVGYVQLELHPAMLKKRAYRIEAVYGAAPLALQASPKTLTLPHDEKVLAESIAEHELDVLIIDPVYFMLERGENTIEDVRPFLDSVNRLKDINNSAIVLVVHTKKAAHDSSGRVVDLGFDAISGHSSFVRWADTVAMVSGTASGVEIQFPKHRHTDDQEAVKPVHYKWTNGLPLALEGSAYARAVDGPPKAAMMLYLSQHGPTFRADLARALPDIPARTVQRALQELVDEGMVKLSESGKRQLVTIGGAV